MLPLCHASIMVKYERSNFLCANHSSKHKCKDGGSKFNGSSESHAVKLAIRNIANDVHNPILKELLHSQQQATGSYGASPSALCMLSASQSAENGTF